MGVEWENLEDGNNGRFEKIAKLYVKNERKYDHRFLTYEHSMKINLSFEPSYSSLRRLKLEL